MAAWKLLYRFGPLLGTRVPKEVPLGISMGEYRAGCLSKMEWQIVAIYFSICARGRSLNVNLEMFAPELRGVFSASSLLI